MRASDFAATAFVACSLLAILSPSPARAASGAGCDRAATSATLERSLREVEADTGTSPRDVVRRSLALEALAGPRGPISRVMQPCSGESPQRYRTAVARANVLRLWSRILALRALDAPIYPAPYDSACRRYDLASVRSSARTAWIERDELRGASLRADLWFALGADPLYPRVAALATRRLRSLGETTLPGFEADESGWAAEARTALAFARSALPAGEPGGPTFALFDVEPETAAYAPLRHRSDRANLSSANVAESSSASGSR